MPKGYGYDKAPKKASGFKMKGYSYPGESPMKGGWWSHQTKGHGGPSRSGESPVKLFGGAAKEGRKTRGHAAHQRGIEQAQEFAQIESTQIADIPNVSYVGSPLSDKGSGVTEQIKSEKHRAYEMSKKHAGKPGFQAYMDRVFGGPTKVKGSVTHTEKRIK
jgi:hypothetical protein